MKRTLSGFWPWNLQRFAAPDNGGGTGSGGAGAGDGGAGTGGQAGEGGQGGQGGSTGGTGEPGGDKGGEQKLTLTQKDLDDMIGKRLARERKAWADQLEEEKKKAAMTEAEKLKAEKEEAEKKAKAATDAANRRLVDAEAKVAAAAAGVKPEKLAYVLKLADLSQIEVGEDGTVDGKAVNAAIAAVLKDLPELTAGQRQVGGGTNPADGGGSNQPTDARKMSEAEFANTLAKYGLRPM